MLGNRCIMRMAVWRLVRVTMVTVAMAKGDCGQKNIAVKELV